MKAVIKLLFFAILAGILFSGCTAIKSTIPLEKGRETQYPEKKLLVSQELLQGKIDKLSNRIEEYKALKKRLKEEEKGKSEQLACLQQRLNNAEGLEKTYKQIDRPKRSS